MSTVDVQLERSEYRPGETVEGSVRWTVSGDAFDSLAISLLWFTEGKGTEDSAVIDRREVASPAGQGAEHFAFRLPAFPWSASGKLVSIVWAIEASLEPGGAVAVARLISAPDARERLLGSVDDDGD
ncbi:MAG: hypothetical protein AAGE94_20835 [Acidobacteriota bacterium]